MIHERDSRIWHKSNGLLRFALYKGLGNAFGRHPLINEYPKSGASWLAQMVAARFFSFRILLSSFTRSKG